MIFASGDVRLTPVLCAAAIYVMFGFITAVCCKWCIVVTPGVFVSFVVGAFQSLDDSIGQFNIYQGAFYHTCCTRLYLIQVCLLLRRFFDSILNASFFIG